MVAPDEAKDLSRSLVRICGSGSDRGLPSTLYDLGIVSSTAATVLVNPNLPAMLNPSSDVTLSNAKEKPSIQHLSRKEFMAFWKKVSERKKRN